MPEIAMIKDGFYIGRVVEGEWFVEPSELSNSNNTSSTKNSYTSRSDYEVARKVSRFISFLGWVVFALGIIVAFAGFVNGVQSRYGGGVSIIGMLPGLGITVSGLFLVAAGQVTRATVDNADHTREILNTLREKA
ncbi:MAG TPA: hypothetical protein ENK06_10080 [Gammaproteobacteria bacterium]|nr:hypothetical protein [Gammaproteobacteria bacterium]